MRGEGPLYVKIAARLRMAIEAGTYRSGDRLPSLTTLAKQFGTSTMPVRTAVKTLHEEGLLKPGDGPYDGTWVV